MALDGMKCLVALGPAAAALFASGRAAADPAAAPLRPRAYAVVVGSNAAGPGQHSLRFAEDDAEQVARLLREIGRFAPDDVHVLLHPGPAEVLRALEDVGAAVRAGAARGEQAEVVFYYSGHAKAAATTLGPLATDELPLQRLRESLSALPAALTVVILDACQSGAFARAKGAEPAADFTYNSVTKLTQRGLAVMASSSGQELSQESDELRGSYFTRHLITALRGAADADGDGKVSLDEAYRYAYRHTLASTARTQVGEQHATLELDLAGHGDAPLTFPVDARARLELPAALDGRVLVQHRPSSAIVAEVQKAPGAAVRLALEAGPYDAVVRLPTGVVQCRVVLADDHVTSLEASECTPVLADTAAAKGESLDERPAREIDRWAIEGAAGAMTRQTDGYTNRLATFGYSEKAPLAELLGARAMVGASRALGPHVSGVLQLTTLGADTYQRVIAGTTDTAAFAGYGAAIALRVSTDVAGRWLGVYAQGGGGLSVGTLKYVTEQTGVAPSSTEVYLSYLLSGAAGATVRFERIPLTLFVQGGYDFAPAIHDLVGDTHDSGGFSALGGLRWRLGGGP